MIWFIQKKNDWVENVPTFVLYNLRKNSVLPNVAFNVFENLKWCCYLITNSITMKPFRFNQLLPDLCSTLFCFPEILYCISSNIFTLFFATIKNAVQKHSWDNFLIFPLKYVINMKHLIWLIVVNQRLWRYENKSLATPIIFTAIIIYLWIVMYLEFVRKNIKAA